MTTIPRFFKLGFILASKSRKDRYVSPTKSHCSVPKSKSVSLFATALTLTPQFLCARARPYHRDSGDVESSDVSSVSSQVKSISARTHAYGQRFCQVFRIADTYNQECLWVPLHQARVDVLLGWKRPAHGRNDDRWHK